MSDESDTAAHQESNSIQEIQERNVAVNLTEEGFKDILKEFYGFLQQKYPYPLLVQSAYLPYLPTEIYVSRLSDNEIYKQYYTEIKKLATKKPIKLLSSTYPKETATIDTVRQHAASLAFIVSFRVDLLYHVDRTWSGKLGMWCCKEQYFDCHVKEYLIAGLCERYKSLQFTSDIVHAKLQSLIHVRLNMQYVAAVQRCRTTHKPLHKFQDFKIQIVKNSTEQPEHTAELMKRPGMIMDSPKLQPNESVGYAIPQQVVNKFNNNPVKIQAWYNLESTPAQVPSLIEHKSTTDYYFAGSRRTTKRETNKSASTSPVSSEVTWVSSGFFVPTNKAFDRFLELIPSEVDFSAYTFPHRSDFHQVLWNARLTVHVLATALDHDPKLAQTQSDSINKFVHYYYLLIHFYWQTLRIYGNFMSRTQRHKESKYFIYMLRALRFDPKFLNKLYPEIIAPTDIWTQLPFNTKQANLLLKQPYKPTPCAKLITQLQLTKIA